MGARIGGLDYRRKKWRAELVTRNGWLDNSM